MIRYPIVILLLLLPILGLGQADTIRRTDNMSARLNFEVALNYSMWNTDLSFTPQIEGYEYEGNLGQGSFAFRSGGITTDFKIGQKLWLQTGVRFSTSANNYGTGGNSSGYTFIPRVGIPINIIKDFNNRDDAPYLSLGLFPHYRVKFPIAQTLNDSNTQTYIWDTSPLPPYQIGIGGEYTYKRYGVDINLGIGKIFYMDGRTYFRMELFYNRNLTNLLEAPNRMNTDILGLRLCFSSMFDKKTK